jgi:hypothetical protein
MKEFSALIEDRAKELDADVMTTRNDPQIKSFWNKLCLLHMRGIVICEEEYEENKPSECTFIAQPQACIQVLHLAEEKTCCQRYFSHGKTPTQYILNR